MKNYNEKFPKNTLRELQGAYTINYNKDGECILIPVIPLANPEPTVDSFAVFTEKYVLTADDFRWYEENGSDRDITYGDGFFYFIADELPDEVFVLLTTRICIKFATRLLNTAKNVLNVAGNDEAKQKIEKAIIDFDKASDNNDKLQIAAQVLSELSYEFIGIDNNLYFSSEIITDVLKELAKRSY